MTHRLWISTFGILAASAAAVVLVGALAPAQDPFGAPMPKAGAPQAGGAPPAADPFGGAAQPGAARPAAAAPADPSKQDPLAIQILRDSNPRAPAELMQAAQTALKFGRPDETRRYLGLLVAAKPADDALAPLAARFGEFLFQLASTKDVQPEGKQVADGVLAAAQRVAQNIDRINALIPQLSAESLGERQDALGKLATGGSTIVTPLLRVLADPAREKEHRYIRAALVHLAIDTEAPLLGALETPNENLKTQIIAVLGRMRSHRATMHLVRPAVDPQAPSELRATAAGALQMILGASPDRYEAEKYLAQQTARLLEGELPYRPDPADRVELWSWDEAQRQVTARKLPKRDAALLLATRVASDLYALKAGDNAALRLMLLTNLDLAKTLGGLDRPLPVDAASAGAAAMAAGPTVVNQVLADALKHGRVAAAIAAAEVLEKLGNASVLTPHDGISPLAEALKHPDRRVRLAAALAIARLAPAASFPGAGQLAPALAWFAATSGEDMVLVAHPRGEDAQSLVGFMNELGRAGQAAYIGRYLMEEAVVNPDVEFILISDAIDLPPVQELVQWLRRDFRTAQIPVGVMARSELLDRTRFAFVDDPLTTVFPRIYSTNVAAVEVARLEEIAGRNRVSRDERIDQARAALAALATLAKTPDNFARHELLRQEPLVIRALANPALSVAAANVLGLFGSPRAQTALVDFASQNTRPLADRQAAAAAFAAAVKARGLLLTQAQLAAQYARYNASETLDKDTQAVQGSLLDAIEAPAIARGDLKK
ncbi:MAG TPA: hypothetical protein VFB80_07395 [Pirellulaceae bacterium]|nr:hypothetical protein [Pirellulaceae bacterium]